MKTSLVTLSLILGLVTSDAGQSSKRAVISLNGVCWYLLTVGNGFNFHTPHWHGNTVLLNGSCTDVVALSRPDGDRGHGP